MEITYTIDPNSVPADEIEKFKSFAYEEIEKKYPDYDITVDTGLLDGAWTDDEENLGAVELFCDGLWDQYGSL